jgi:capsular exopolysaccharide synthesis family protein
MSKKNNYKGNLITYTNSDSNISDQFRAIRTNIKFLPGDKRKRTILITSPGKAEGKSMTAANLAVSMAQQGEAVLLMDANLRAPVMHHMFNISNQDGLTDLLTDRASLNEVTYKTGIGKLDILTSGGTKVNPAELLESERMENLLHTALDSYNMILIDSSSVLKSTETRVLANQCDGVVLVIKRRKTKMSKIAESRKLLELVDAKLVGAIMNEK